LPALFFLHGRETRNGRAKAIAAGVRRSELRLVEGAGHLVEIARPDEVVHAVLSD